MSTVRKGQAPPPLGRAEFHQRFMQAFFDPAFRAEDAALARLEELAWQAYGDGRKAPVTQPAGAGFADPSYQLSVEWRETRDRLQEAQRLWSQPQTPSRVLLVCGSSRNDGTCPGEMSKTFRLVQLAQEVLVAQPIGLGVRPAHPPLQRLRGYGDAAVPLALQLLPQPRRAPDRRLDERDLPDVGARARRDPDDSGVLVPGCQPAETDDRPPGLRRWRQSRSHHHARQAAGGGQGWDYPKHLAGRTYGVVVHGDVAGTEGVRRALCDWLDWMGLIDAGARARLDRLVGYYAPYALSHEALDQDLGVQEETRNVARAVAHAVRELRAGRLSAPDRQLKDPRPK
jgi:hypothetical protein